MPEIKHNFTGGKMNKDLDERLVPNGEYRDAMNIQVSTSEGSDVGTVQNILGNSLILGQNFINKNAYCVGSIADEKNDKLYYFIENSIELIPNTELENNNDWLLSATMDAGYSGRGVYLKSNGTSGSMYPSWRTATDMVFIDGQEYELSVRFTQTNIRSSSNENKYFLYGFEAGQPTPNYRPLVGTGSNVSVGGNAVISNGTFTHNFTFDKAANGGFDTLRFYVELTDGGNNVKKVRVENVSIKRKAACIIEYDSKTNSITPVIIDINNKVLNFSSDNLINNGILLTNVVSSFSV